ncbi:MAG: SDR family oxidoreductase [Anaerolineales bacterium]|nr:SDR family oxidoreductase [Anaerolineales bacterium]
MRRLLITGASGLLGLNLALQALDQYQVFGIANSDFPQTDLFEIRDINLLNERAVDQMLDWAKPDLLIHCAAIANVDFAEKNPELAQQLNADLPGEIARTASQRGVRMLHISTDMVFDGLRGGYSEEDIPNPQNVYSRTKLAGENAVLESSSDAVVSRVNFYGWSMAGSRSLVEFFYNNLSAENRINGFDDVTFCPTFVGHLGQALLALLEGGHKGLFHTVSPQVVSKYDFGVAVARQFGFDEALITPISVADAGLVAARSPHLEMDSSKLSRALGAPLPGLDEGLNLLHMQVEDGYRDHLHSMYPSNTVN